MLAEEAGLDVRELQRIEAAEVDFGVVKLAALCVALGVTPDLVFAPARLANPVRGRPRTRTRTD